MCANMFSGLIGNRPNDREAKGLIREALSLTVTFRAYIRGQLLLILVPRAYDPSGLWQGLRALKIFQANFLLTALPTQKNDRKSSLVSFAIDYGISPYKKNTMILKNQIR